MLLERSVFQMGGQGFLKDSGEQVALLGGAGKKLLHVLITSHQGNCHDSGAVSGCAWVSFLFPSLGERLGSREGIFWAHRGQLWCGQVRLSPLFPVKTAYLHSCVSVSPWKFIMARGHGGKYSKSGYCVALPRGVEWEPLLLTSATWPLVTALTCPKCHGHSEAGDLFPTKALDFSGEQLLSLAARLMWRAALPLGGIGRRGINPPSQGQRSIIQREMVSGEMCE